MAWAQLVKRGRILSKNQVLSLYHHRPTVPGFAVNTVALHSDGEDAKSFEMMNLRSVSFRIQKDRAYSSYIDNLARKLKQADNYAEAALLREYNKTDPEYVIHWYERSPPYQWYKPAFLAEYLKALVKVDKLDEHELLATLKEGVKARAGGTENLQTVPSLGGTPLFLNSIGSTPRDGVLGSANSPIYMVNSEGGFRQQFWRFLRFLAMAFILISALGAFADDRGITKGLGFNEEVRPTFETNTKFDDVKGVDEAKAELQEIVLYLKDPKRFTVLGGKLPKGMLLSGPPGTGKTMLARAIAGEAGVPFFYCSGSEFEEMFVGVGARRVRDLFAAAKRHAPCIVFIDELDAIGGRRTQRDQQYMRMTLNQLLVELDGFKQNEGIIVIGATNFPESLDKALIRPGRFDQHVEVPYPDVEGRRQILESYLSKVPKGDDVDAAILARGTPGLAGADLANIVNVAALKAAMDGSKAVTMPDLEYAKDKILMGTERKSAVRTEESRRGTAYHEGGHALVAVFTEGAEPVHKATIVPRGTSLGMVLQLPEEDRLNLTRTQMLASMRVALAGRAAEEIIFGDSEVTTGASQDLQNATKYAKGMVSFYGMSSAVGPVVYDIYNSSHTMSTETKHVVESEVKKLLDEAYEDAKQTLITHIEELHALAQALLEHETLTGAQIKDLIAKVKASKTVTPVVSQSSSQSTEQQFSSTLPIAAGAAAQAVRS
ncbi:hypothetical protein KP509_08G016800 [Ceratopteris richardii]|uniref:AAA+ ATPase domain-containing protein n=1 Tax=Ceratopteris richardii TaxID=49495 RepID=A0A8T2U8G3_CERRI|nr:hypothetical protein KP509_08G016800 [Ceratopteris richardii]